MAQSTVPFKRCGRSGVMLPALSLGLWHNFGDGDDPAEARALVRRAFDAGIVHFDLANNYGPPPGSAEKRFGLILRQDFRHQRDQMFIATKAGHLMWDGPYGEWGSRKHLMSSLDQSLSRLGLDYVDVFYSHRPDPDTPLEETMGALADAVNRGKALYVGISKYPGPMAAEAAEILRSMEVPCLVHQPPLNLLNRWPEANGLPPVLEEKGMGCVAFSPLAQGMLTEKYLEGIPKGSRADRPDGFLRAGQVESARKTLRALAALARERGDSLPQLALAWVLKQPYVTSALIGARTVAQLEENLSALEREPLSAEEIARIDAICPVTSHDA